MVQTVYRGTEEAILNDLGWVELGKACKRVRLADVLEGVLRR